MKKIVNVKLSQHTVPTLPKVTKDSRGWLVWGKGNKAPGQLLEDIGASPVNGSILRSKITYTVGKGTRGTSAANFKPNPEESWDDLIRCIATDYITFGGFALQVVPNVDNKTVTIYHQDFTEVRVGEIDEYGKPESFVICADWSRPNGKTKPVPIPKWPGSVDKCEPDADGKAQPHLVYVKDYYPGSKYYPVPDYYEAIDYIIADGLLGPFFKNSIKNGFTPSVVISMPSNPSEEEKAEVQADMEASFQGPAGASEVVILWGENKTVKPEIVPFNASANADIYNNVEGIIFQKIISAHRLSSPTLAGVSGSGNLSGNASEIIDSFILFNYSVIEAYRNKILDVLNEFTRMRSQAPLVIEDLDVVAKIRESETEKGETFTLTKSK